LNSTFHTIEVSDPAYEHEGLRVVTVKSPALGRRGDVSVWVPEANQIRILLILLHGVYGSHWAWSLRGGAHRTAQSMLSAGELAPMVIAMPSDGLARDGSAYLNYLTAENAERWIVDEVPATARLAAPALRTDAKIVIGGLSMGGYGALRLGAKYADRFSGISAHSAITEISEMAEFLEEPLSDYLQSASREELSPIYWLRKHRGMLPELRFDCGIGDKLIEGNRALHEALQAEGIAHTYEEYSGGHEWSYWQRHVEKTLRFASKLS
jgi:putative tributyrin esterase